MLKLLQAIDYKLIKNHYNTLYLPLPDIYPRKTYLLT